MTIKRKLAIAIFGSSFVLITFIIFSTDHPTYIRVMQTKHEIIFSRHDRNDSSLSNNSYNLKDRLVNLKYALLEAQSHFAAKEAIKEAIKDKGTCERYFNESNTVKEVFLRVWTDDLTPFADVTFVTFTSLSRFSALDAILTHWGGPLSLVFYVEPSDVEKLVAAIEGHPTLLQRKYIELSIMPGVYEYFPNNYLRQVALDQVRTSHVFLCDVDLIPSFTLYRNLLDLRDHVRGKKVLVIPSFEQGKQIPEFTFPTTKKELISYWDRGIVQPFLYSYFKPSYQATNFFQWRNTDKIYSTKYKYPFEPYVFAERKHLPKYEIRLQGQHYDKISYFCQLSKHLKCADQIMHQMELFPDKKKKLTTRPPTVYITPSRPTVPSLTRRRRRRKKQKSPV